MYSLFDYYFQPPTRTVYVVSEEQLEKIKLKQKNAEIKEVESQLKELDAAYDRRKSSLNDSLATLRTQVKELDKASEPKSLEEALTG
tara:strand:- start:82 stop:342 length:261 start_codon:yes stop_codon:yes gene_type:complete